MLPAEADFLSPQSSQMGNYFFVEGRLVDPSVRRGDINPQFLRQRPPKFSDPILYRGLEWLTPKQRTFYHKYLRQAVMDVFNP